MFSSMTTITSLLNTNIESDQSTKKVEENVVAHMKVIQKALRGCPTLWLASGLTDTPYHITQVGQDHLLRHLSQDDKNVVVNIRIQVLEFLSQIFNPKLNPTILKAWCKLFKILVLCMPTMKTSINYDHYLKATAGNARPMVVKAILKGMKIRGVYNHNQNTLPTSTAISSNSMIGAMSTLNYWNCHDLSTNFISNKGWALNFKRQMKASYDAMHAALDSNSSLSGPLLQNYSNLLSLCGHEYESVRSKAVLTAGLSTISRFGNHVNSLLASQCSVLQSVTPGVAKIQHPQLFGIFSILQQTKVITKMTNNWNFAVEMLNGLMSSSQVISLIDDRGKQEELYIQLANTFVTYLCNWHNLPIHLDEQTISQTNILFENIFEKLGVGSISNISLRQGAMTGFILLHLIGHSDITPLIPLGVWDWVIRTVIGGNGQPIQNIALAILQRMIQNIEVKNLFGHPLIASLRKITTELDTPQTELDSNSWLGFLKGVSQCHLKHDDSASSQTAQWSNGVDQILHATDYVSQVLPRKLYWCGRNDGLNNSFSSSFSYLNASLFMNILDCGVLFPEINISSILQTSQITTSTVVARLSSFLRIGDQLPTTGVSDVEIQEHNATRAELFGGLMRSIVNLMEIVKKQHEHPLMSLLRSMEQSLTDYFIQQIEKVSYEMSKAWAEAVFFSCNAGEAGCRSDSPLVRFIFESFQQVVTSQLPSESNVLVVAMEVGDSSSSSSLVIEETNLSFSNQAKLFVLMYSLLLAGAANGLRHQETPNNEIAVRLMSLLSTPQACLISPFRNVRTEMAHIFYLLSTTSIVGNDHQLYVQKLESILGSIVAVSKESETQTNLNSSNVDVSGPNLRFKHAIDIAHQWLSLMCGFSPSLTCSLNVTDSITPLFNVILTGCGHSDRETAYSSQLAVLSTLQRVGAHFTYSNQVGVHRSSPDLLGQILNQLCLMATSPFSQSQPNEQPQYLYSWHIRQAVFMGLSRLMTNNWFMLTNDERKTCRDAFLEGFHDEKPEVQFLAEGGMIGYLGYKTESELKQLANVYLKNSETLAAREMKKKKAAKAMSLNSDVQTLVQTDRSYVTTVIMSGCVIQALPFDLPDYLPALLCSFLKHADLSPVHSIKDSVKRIVRNFKRSHQDRWLGEFSRRFSKDQLDDLQGAGASHYFS